MSQEPDPTAVLDAPGKGQAEGQAGQSTRCFPDLDSFARRHLGSSQSEVEEMLASLGLANLNELITQTVPSSILLDRPPTVGVNGQATGERQVGARLAELAGQNLLFRSFLGMGYHDSILPGVIRRNVFENPGWYTQYTPYQSEISQGRLEALLNFQTVVEDLTGLPLANASLLDEGTAAAEAMAMCWSILRRKRSTFFVSSHCHPQTVAVIATRAEALGIRLEVGDEASLEPGPDLIGVLLQYPTSDGRVLDYAPLVEAVHAAGAMAVLAADPLALTLLRPPGELGADIAVGSMQRFGVPMGFGGPHAGYLACRQEHARKMPGRMIGVSKDRHGKIAYRMALQTREQHIRREKATSNICTAQVLLAILAGFYAVYHGPEGLRQIARRVHSMTTALRAGLQRLGFGVGEDPVFDTLRVELGRLSADDFLAAAEARQVNVRRLDEHTVGVTLDEATSDEDLSLLLDLFAVFGSSKKTPELEQLAEDSEGGAYPAPHGRTSEFMIHPVFHRYHTEHEMLRYIKRLESRDLSLTTSMIPLGSCTMKLNATAEMEPVGFPGFSQMHPFAPPGQTKGYLQLFSDLETWLSDLTGFAEFSLQPNAGSQGEYAGMMVIRAYHQSRGDHGRDLCLIPVSAHGTNPASASLAGMAVKVVDCDEAGNIDVADLEAKAAEAGERLAAIMVTYPSTHGVFEESIQQVCDIVHRHGGQVYLDGANMNAQVGLCRPGDFGADVCHLNLHKTFCIPHGGGGPGMGPIGVAKHLAPFLPGHPLVEVGGSQAIGPISAAPWGSPSILPISWAFIALMGGEGLAEASRLAILNANYMAERLASHYEILYRGENGRVAHEFILDLRPFKGSAGIEAEDVAKRLMDFGFHAPTMSWPVTGTLMVEPTESESKAELDRFCEAMITIREEIRAIEEGRLDREVNPLTLSPHTAEVITADTWDRPYGREQAAFPLPWVRANKFWPSVGRVDNAFGDKNLVCSCPPLSDYE